MRMQQSGGLLLATVHAEKEAVKEEVRKLTEVREEVRAEAETLTQEKTRRNGFCPG